MGTRTQALDPRILILFGASMVMPGLGILGMSGWQAWSYLDTDDWEPVPVTIEHVELEEFSSSGKSGTSFSYQVDCRYRYQFDGIPYTGERVDLTQGSSGFEDYHRDLYEELRAHQTSGTPFEALVDPDDPSQAILVRESGGQGGALALFGLVFLLVGAGLSAAGYQLHRRKGRLDQIEDIR